MPPTLILIRKLSLLRQAQISVLNLLSSCVFVRFNQSFLLPLLVLSDLAFQHIGLESFIHPAHHFCVGMVLLDFIDQTVRWVADHERDNDSFNKRLPVIAELLVPPHGSFKHPQSDHVSLIRGHHFRPDDYLCHWEDWFL